MCIPHLAHQSNLSTVHLAPIQREFHPLTLQLDPLHRADAEYQRCIYETLEIVISYGLTFSCRQSQLAGLNLPMLNNARVRPKAS